MKEADVQRALGLGGEDRLQEQGVYPPPDRDPARDLARLPNLAVLPGPGEVVLTEEWLSDLDLETHFSADGRLEASLPGRRLRALRLDIDPAVLVFEHVPAPLNSLGAVHPGGADGCWIMDTRGAPAALVLPDDDHDLVIWGEYGTVRLFAVRPVRH